MKYPLYNYYLESKLTLDEVLKHYINTFYLKNHGKDKVEKIFNKVLESNKVKEIFEGAAECGFTLKCTDFGSVINEIKWFMFQSNRTQVVAILAAAVVWDRKYNEITSQKELRDEVIKIFQKYSIYEEMTEKQYKEMTRKEDKTIIDDNNTTDFESESSRNEDEEYPKPLCEPLNNEDREKLLMPEYADKVLQIMIDGGTEEQTKIKLEILLNKRQKTEYMNELEKEIRNYFREIFEMVGKKVVEDSNGNPLIIKLNMATKLLEWQKKSDDVNINPTIKQLQEIANKTGVSWNIIKNEEYKRALDIYLK